MLMSGKKRILSYVQMFLTGVSLFFALFYFLTKRSAIDCLLLALFIMTSLFVGFYLFFFWPHLLTMIADLGRKTGNDTRQIADYLALKGLSPQINRHKIYFDIKNFPVVIRTDKKSYGLFIDLNNEDGKFNNLSIESPYLNIKHIHEMGVAIYLNKLATPGDIYSLINQIISQL